VLDIDGSMGEGGGQVLRTALTLSLCLGRAFHLANIRAARRRPGLQRQHLVAVRAAAAISGAEVHGDALDSPELTFVPGAVRPGDYRFDIGSAGSTSLVLQTVLLPLLGAPGPSGLRVQGGTHNPMAPTFEFLRDAYLPLIRRMGGEVAIELTRPGFYPVGGGELVATIAPSGRLRALDLQERGPVGALSAGIWLSHLPVHIFEREAEVLRRGLGLAPEAVTLHAQVAAGPGNAIYAVVPGAEVTEVFSAIGRKGRPAEQVAGEVVAAVDDYLASGVPVGPHLCDQLLLPMALAGGGTFRAAAVTSHAATNARVIEAFGVARITFESDGAGASCRVES